MELLIDTKQTVNGHAPSLVSMRTSAEVTAVCATKNVEMVRSIGADHVIDYTSEDFTRNGQRYDFILDNVANHSLSDTRRVLTPTGKLQSNNGWGNYFRTGNAARKFNQMDGYVGRRLRAFLSKRHGRNLKARQADQWANDWFWAQGLHRLRGTVRYPETA